MKSPISPVCLDFCQNRRFRSLEIADFRRLAIYRQAQIRIASRMSKIADLATYRQKWQHCTNGLGPWDFTAFTAESIKKSKSQSELLIAELLRLEKWSVLVSSLNSVVQRGLWFRAELFLRL